MMGPRLAAVLAPWTLTGPLVTGVGNWTRGKDIRGNDELNVATNSSLFI